MARLLTYRQKSQKLAKKYPGKAATIRANYKRMTGSSLGSGGG